MKRLLVGITMAFALAANAFDFGDFEEDWDSSSDFWSQVETVSVSSSSLSSSTESALSEMLEESASGELSMGGYTWQTSDSYESTASSSSAVSALGSGSTGWGSISGRRGGWLRAWIYGRVTLRFNYYMTFGRLVVVRDGRTKLFDRTVLSFSTTRVNVKVTIPSGLHRVDIVYIPFNYWFWRYPYRWYPFYYWRYPLTYGSSSGTSGMAAVSGTSASSYSSSQLDTLTSTQSEGEFTLAGLEVEGSGGGSSSQSSSRQNSTVTVASGYPGSKAMTYTAILTENGTYAGLLTLKLGKASRKGIAKATGAVVLPSGKTVRLTGASVTCGSEEIAVQTTVKSLGTLYATLGTDAAIEGSIGNIDVRKAVRGSSLAVTPVQLLETLYPNYQIVNANRLKWSITKSTGAFRGTFRLKPETGRKTYSVKVTGYILNGVGYGTATARGLGTYMFSTDSLLQ